MTEHPITPPPELMQQLWRVIADGSRTWSDAITDAYRAGADQELDACCEYLKRTWAPSATIDNLRTNRRPKPPSLKEQALTLLDKAEDSSWDINDFSIVRRALELLPND